MAASKTNLDWPAARDVPSGKAGRQSGCIVRDDQVAGAEEGGKFGARTVSDVSCTVQRE
jgi:hypothetical protein